MAPRPGWTKWRKFRREANLAWASLSLDERKEWKQFVITGDEKNNLSPGPPILKESKSGWLIFLSQYMRRRKAKFPPFKLPDETPFPEGFDPPHI